MKESVYTVEWIEDNNTEVSITYEDYHEAYTMFQDLKEQDTVEELVFSIRNKEKTQENPQKTTEFIKKKVEIKLNTKRNTRENQRKTQEFPSKSTYLTHSGTRGKKY